MKKSRLFLLSFLIAVCFNDPALANQEDAAFLRKAAEQYMLAQFAKTPGMKREDSAGNIDEGKNYGGRCEGYLTAQLQGRRIQRNNQVKMVCKKPSGGYTVLVPVTVRKLIPTLTAVQNLPRRTVLDESMLSQSYVDADLNSAQAVTDITLLEGSRLKKDIKAGEQIKNGDFCMVCRGDPVAIEAKTGSLSVKTSGQALSDGNYGDQVQVRNTKTRKLVNGLVTAPGVITVPL